MAEEFRSGSTIKDREVPTELHLQDCEEHQTAPS